MGVSVARICFVVVVGLAWQQLGPAQSVWTAEELDLIEWARAVQDWTRESPDGAEAQLARGVLLECLSSPMRGDGLPDTLSRHDREACGPMTPSGAASVSQPVALTWYSGPMLTLRCWATAASAYEKVLTKDPSHGEAQLRLAGLRVREVDPKRSSGNRSAEARLTTLAATSPDRQLRFLAQLFLGLAAEKRKDLAAARAHYEAARGVGPEWPSARHALASVLLQQGEVTVAKDTLPENVRPESADPWYGYSCRIMTSRTLAELRQRQARQKTP